MADPISISSGIAGLISLAGLVLGQCYSYGCAVADAPSEAKMLASELTNLSGVLVGIQGFVNSTDDGNSYINILPVLQGCEQTLQDALDRLSAVSATGRHTSLKRTINRFAWPLRKSETMALIMSIERRKQTLSLAFGTLTA